MDQDEIKKSILERFNNLQPEIQNAIMDSNYEKNLYEISQKYKLNVEQMGQLEFNTTLVLLGQTHPDEYSQELEEDLKLPKEKIDEIVNDVNDKIMKNIRDLIKKNFEDDDAEEKAESEVPLPPYASTEQIDEKAGVEILSTESVATETLAKKEPVKNENITPKTESKIYQNAGIDILDKTMNLDELNINNNIIADKLSKPIINKPTVSNQSLPKVTKITNTEPSTTGEKPISSDPYREVIN